MDQWESNCRDFSGPTFITNLSSDRSRAGQFSQTTQKTPISYLKNSWFDEHHLPFILSGMATFNNDVQNRTRKAHFSARKRQKPPRTLDRRPYQIRIWFRKSGYSVENIEIWDLSNLNYHIIIILMSQKYFHRVHILVNSLIVRSENGEIS